MQFTNPDSIKNAVKRYNRERAAERDEYKRDRDTQKLSKMRFCKMRCNNNDVLGMVTSRDLDVETQMSLNAADMTAVQLAGYNSGTSDNSDSSGGKSGCGLRMSSDQENARVRSRMRLVGGADKRISGRTKGKVIHRRKLKSLKPKKQALFSLEDTDPYCKQIEGLHREVCAELNVMRAAQLEQESNSKLGRIAGGKTSKLGSNKRKTTNKIASIISKAKNNVNNNIAFSKKKLPFYCKPQEKMMFSGNANQKLTTSDMDPDSIMQRLRQVLSVDQKMFAMQTSYLDYSQAQWADVIPSPILPHVEEAVECQTQSPNPLPECPQVADDYYADDSDLEQEFVDRPAYMRYIERLPYNGSEQEIGDVANSQKGCFVDLEPHPHWISCKRSLKPMHYTSQRSDTDTSTLCDPEEQKELLAEHQRKHQQQQQPHKHKQQHEQQQQEGKQQLKQHQHKRQRQHEDQHHQDHQQQEKQQQQQQKQLLQEQQQYLQGKLEQLQVKNDEAGEQLPQRHKLKAMPAMQAADDKTAKSMPKSPRPVRHGKLQDTAAVMTNRQPGGRDKQLPSPTPVIINGATASASPNSTPTTTTPRRRKARTVVVTQSLENLKYEKMVIYNRISMTQERIIGALDNLQCRLLKLQIPTCSNQEKLRRERNAFEFCVKFSRNFLYPLRGLIDEVRCTAMANYHSATSNEASQKVACSYQLMLNSIGSYKRRLRYFLLDKVPQKLSALIEMMYTLTNVCLDKGILDRQDPVVECLQQRCTNFLSFIEDMQQERFQLARETYRRLQKRTHGHGRGEGGTHERYDLKMFLNDLKLYEPRLVPKDRTEKQRSDKNRSEKQPRVRVPRKRKVPSLLTTEQVPAAPSLEIAKLQKELTDVTTHIECVHCGDCRNDGLSTEADEEVPPSNQKEQLSNILALLQQPHRERRELHQQLLEAMEHVTKSQVREVLDPLVRSLGVMINKKVLESSGVNEAFFPY